MDAPVKKIGRARAFRKVKKPVINFKVKKSDVINRISRAQAVQDQALDNILNKILPFWKSKTEGKRKINKRLILKANKAKHALHDRTQKQKIDELMIKEEIRLNALREKLKRENEITPEEIEKEKQIVAKSVLSAIKKNTNGRDGTLLDQYAFNVMDKDPNKLIFCVLTRNQLETRIREFCSDERPEGSCFAESIMTQGMINTTSELERKAMYELVKDKGITDPQVTTFFRDFYPQTSIKYMAFGNYKQFRAYLKGIGYPVNSCFLCAVKRHWCNIWIDNDDNIKMIDTQGVKCSKSYKGYVLSDCIWPAERKFFEALGFEELGDSGTYWEILIIGLMPDNTGFSLQNRDMGGVSTSDSVEGIDFSESISGDVNEPDIGSKKKKEKKKSKKIKSKKRKSKKKKFKKKKHLTKRR